MALDIPAAVLDLLRCPQCHGALRVQGERGLACERCRLIYRGDQGILDMLIEDALPLDGA
ncbi:MAG TPA: Trm112 family protein [Candidatus Angelobacter sp.]|jgi:uncharacterized protein YbaR (Trm112 family)|nr:Trm112 family protein [Candidatus Angelobacter sp.]